MPFAVNTADVATPLAFVVAVFTPPATSRSLPFEPGPRTSLLLRVADSRHCPSRWLKVDAKAAPIKVLCGVPPVAAIEFTQLGALTVTLSNFVEVSKWASVTFTVKVLVPVPVGVPEITPVVDASVRPAGNVPDVRDQVYGGVPPAAATVATACRRHN